LESGAKSAAADLKTTNPTHDGLVAKLSNQKSSHFRTNLIFSQVLMDTAVTVVIKIGGSFLPAAGLFTTGIRNHEKN
jgi:hypothetical protein